ncbi:hypothetical protein BC941DRAFT_431154 [Chlamydoabsidia padenii]|nr:hypothetical protein BC941DRAFT_431154 [Chlamydoabsidia padenii]
MHLDNYLNSFTIQLIRFANNKHCQLWVGTLGIPLPTQLLSTVWFSFGLGSTSAVSLIKKNKKHILDGKGILVTGGVNTALSSSRLVILYKRYQHPVTVIRNRMDTSTLGHLTYSNHFNSLPQYYNHGSMNQLNISIGFGGCLLLLFGGAI